MVRNMIEYFKSIRILDGKPNKVIVDDTGKIVKRDPTKDELGSLEREPYARNKILKKYNETNTCDICRENGKTIMLTSENARQELDKSGNPTRRWTCDVCYAIYDRYGVYEKPEKCTNTLGWLRKQQKIKANIDEFDDIEKWLRWESEENIIKNEKNTLRWFKEQQKIKAKKDGFENVDNWKKWRSDPFNVLEKKYGREFADWARENKDKVPKWWLDSGCKTQIEYLNKCARDLGFKDFKEQNREYARNYTYKTGRHVPLEFNEDCSPWFGEFTEKLMIHRYPGAKKMPYGNPWFDYLWIDKEGKETTINNKGRCLTYCNWSPYLSFGIRWNNKAKKFILSGWDNRDDLNPLVAWEFDKDDLVRKGYGKNAQKVKFWKRDVFQVTYTSEGIEQFEDHQIDIDWLEELCRNDKDI